MELDSEEKGGNRIVTVLIAVLIVLIWLAIFALLVKFDVGGFGSGVLRPILKDVPVINKILPDVSDELLAEENGTEPTLEELAEYTKMDVEELQELED